MVGAWGGGRGPTAVGLTPPVLGSDSNPAAMPSTPAFHPRPPTHPPTHPPPTRAAKLFPLYFGLSAAASTIQLGVLAFAAANAPQKQFVLLGEQGGQVRGGALCLLLQQQQQLFVLLLCPPTPPTPVLPPPPPLPG